ncbi:glycosyltransferase [Amaricoccus macauensis]|uniref:glycosyltransferase n=1 Tax=Amaricoccus macauensis TaxID=57001 RepID=UPI003C7A0B4B
MAGILPLSAGLRAKSTGSGQRVRIGDHLVQSGALSEAVLLDALEDQKRQDQKLGRILIANRAISDDDLLDALSNQTGLGRVDLAQKPCDPQLFGDIDPYLCLELDAAPWRLVGDILTIVIANPEAVPRVVEALGSQDYHVTFALAPPAQIRDQIIRNCAGRMRVDARTRCPEALSCRGWTQAVQKSRSLRAILIAMAAAAAFHPAFALQIVMVWILIANSATMGLRLVALFTRATRTRVDLGAAETSEPDLPPPSSLAPHQKLPRVSILVPLLREEAVAQSLLSALRAMDYPAALLDIKLVLEEDDDQTRAAIARADLPPTIEVLVVPNDGLKTKPRAMNYALPFCLGEIVGIYDAEDHPEPGQIRKVVEHLKSAPRDVACVQGFLDFYNPRENWISRCFTLEYAIWFRVVLLGVQRLGIPIPLGGTTVFFRRALLERIGGWDAHNVTEDADLGMRLARFGYRCEMVKTTTMEEANCRPLNWIRQRSRWLKGYAITWATHMRQPRALLSDLGWRGFLGFQVLFLGAMTSYLSLPLFWAILIGSAGFGFAFWESYPQWMLTAFFASMIMGQVVMLVSGIVAALDTRRPYLIPWILTLFAYWPLGAIAAYRAVGEIFSRPSYWHKTDHGHSSVAAPTPIAPELFRPRVVWPPSEAGSRKPD